MLARVDTIEVVTTFKPDPAVVLTIAPHLQAVQKAAGGTILTLNVPEGAPPELPRLVLQLPDALLRVASGRFSFVLKPPTHIATSFGEVLEYAKNRVIPMLSKLVKARLKYGWSGVISNVEFPEDPSGRGSMQAIRPVIERLVNLPWPIDSFATFDLQIGRRVNSLFYNYRITGYETRELGFKGRVGQPIRIAATDLDKAPISEVGVQIAIDINNKARKARNAPLADLNVLMAAMASAHDSLTTDLNLEGII